MLGAISIRLRQARLERERETHTHTQRRGREGGGEGSRGACEDAHALPAPSFPAPPAPRTAHSPAGSPGGGMRGGGGRLAGRRLPARAAGACAEPSPPPSFFAGGGHQTGPNPGRWLRKPALSVPLSGGPLVLCLPTLCSSQGCYFLPAELARLTSRLLFFFFLIANFCSLH